MAVSQNRKADDLTPEQVVELRALRGKMTARDAGFRFNRSADTVRRIWRGEAYREGYVTSQKLEADQLFEEASHAKALEEVQELMRKRKEGEQKEVELDETSKAWLKRVGQL